MRKAYILIGSIAGAITAAYKRTHKTKPKSATVRRLRLKLVQEILGVTVESYKELSDEQIQTIHDRVTSPGAMHWLEKWVSRAG